ncbi:unnamed protein product [Gordionus sp. m RMFG-2023]
MSILTYNSNKILPSSDQNINNFNIDTLQPMSMAKNELPRPKPGQILHRTANDFFFFKIIGEGSFSTVYKSRDIHTLKYYAIKVMDKRHIIKLHKQSCVKKEKELLQALNANPHPFFVKLYCTFQDFERLFIVMSYAKNGEILNYINLKHCFDLEISRFYAAELTCALEHLHKMGIVHRDIKPENILLDENFHIKITDFGSATFSPFESSPTDQDTEDNKSDPSSDNSSSTNDDRAQEKSDDDTKSNKIATNGVSRTVAKQNNRHSSFVGTAQYVSPEILTSKPVTYVADLWALGCVVYQFITGNYPFRANNEYHIFQKILRLNYDTPLYMDADARDFIQKLLKIKPSERLGSPNMGGYPALKSHPFLHIYLENFENLYKTESPLLVKLLVAKGSSNILRATESDKEESEFTKYPIKPGLNESQLSRLHGLGLLQETFSQLTFLNNNETPDTAIDKCTTHHDNIKSIQSSDEHNVTKEKNGVSLSKESQTCSTKNSSDKVTTSTAFSDSSVVSFNKNSESNKIIVGNKGDHINVSPMKKDKKPKRSFLKPPKLKGSSKKLSMMIKIGVPPSIFTYSKNRPTMHDNLSDKESTADHPKTRKFVDSTNDLNGDRKNSLPAMLPHHKSDSYNSEQMIRLVNNCRFKFMEGQEIVNIGIVHKRVGLFTKRRMLILTDAVNSNSDIGNSMETNVLKPHPHLFYLDPTNMILKGEIPWSEELKVEPKNFKIFFVITPNRTYFLEESEGFALKWCAAISKLHQKYFPNTQFLCIR